MEILLVFFFFCVTRNYPTSYEFKESWQEVTLIESKLKIWTRTIQNRFHSGAIITLISLYCNTFNVHFITSFKITKTLIKWMNFSMSLYWKSVSVLFGDDFSKRRSLGELLLSRPDAKSKMPWSPHLFLCHLLWNFLIFFIRLWEIIHAIIILTLPIR